MLAKLRDGDWITLERVRVYSLIFIACYVLTTLGWLATLRNGLDWQDRPAGTDFAEVYAAGTLVNDGHPDKPYKFAAHFERQRQLFGEKTSIATWNYPPYFLALAGALATLPYLASWLVWQLGTLPAYLAGVRGFLRAPVALLAAAAFPAVFVNFGHGQTGFLVAGLLAGGLGLLDKRPILAGILFGLLAFKPQFGPLIPLALAAGGRWRTFAAAAATLALMTLGTLLAYGPDVWTAFFQSLPYTRQYGLEESNTGFYKMQSLFAAVRMLGGPVPLAYGLHGVLMAMVAAAVAWIWRGAADRRLKSAALMIGALLATPYCFDYDMVVLGPAIACLASYGLERGFAPWEKSVLALAFLTPSLARLTALAISLPFGLMIMLALFWLALRHAAAERGAEGRSWRTPRAA